jgi:tRNA(fMet)-specific endonuclease VapC
MLDTDTVSFALRGVGRVGQRLLDVKPSEVCISSLTLAELRFGAERRRSRRLHRVITDFTSPLVVASFDADAADRFGQVGSALVRAGTPIGQMDTLIAAHALALKVVLVSNNARHFGKVRGLETVSWL